MSEQPTPPGVSTEHVSRPGIITYILVGLSLIAFVAFIVMQ
jgi:hypothetical protein